MNCTIGPSIRRPALLIASTCSLARSTNVTSCPARARCAPRVPPIAPAPHTRSCISLASAVFGEAVADQAEGDANDQQREAGKRRHPPCEQEELAPFGDHRAPLRCGRLGTEPEEAQGRAGEDCE